MQSLEGGVRRWWGFKARLRRYQQGAYIRGAGALIALLVLEPVGNRREALPTMLRLAQPREPLPYLSH